MDNNIEISIIVPVYNIEKYLPRMIESVLSQSFESFEMILTDDGSKDKSGEICDEYAKKDKRVKVLHQDNQGAHMARNNALRLAKGRYICFFDGDDYIDKDTLKDMYEMAMKDNLDLVVSGFYIETYYDVDKYITLDYVPESNIYMDKQSFRKESPKYFDINMFYPPWNKLYKKEHLDKYNIEFPRTYRDDFPFVMSVIRDINKVGYTSNQYYHFFRQRAESETQKYVKNLYEKREEEQKLMIDTFTYWGLIDDKDVKDMLARRYLDRLIECIVNLQNVNCTLNKSEKKKEVERYIDNAYVKQCLEDAKPKKIYLDIMYKILAVKNVDMILFMASFISNVKKKDVKMFSVLKKNR